MKRCLRLLGGILILGGCTTAAIDSPLRAQAVLRDKSGQQVGTATLTEGADGVRIQVTASHLPPGPKGVHVHAVGTCDPPDFVSAGAHFNPTGRKHGRLNPDGSHAGDLPNLVIGAAVGGSLEAMTPAVTLKSGAAGSLSLFMPAPAKLRAIEAESPDPAPTTRATLFSRFAITLCLSARRPQISLSNW